MLQSTASSTISAAASISTMSQSSHNLMGDPGPGGGGGNSGGGGDGGGNIVQNLQQQMQQQQQQRHQSQNIFHAHLHTTSSSGDQNKSSQNQSPHHLQQQIHQSDDFSHLVVSGLDDFNSSQSQQVFSLNDHTDDENDVFQCGKCKQQFCQLKQFVGHKLLCNNNNQNNQLPHKSPIHAVGMATSQSEIVDLVDNLNASLSQQQQQQQQHSHHPSTIIHHHHHQSQLVNSVGKLLMMSTNNNNNSTSSQQQQQNQVVSGLLSDNNCQHRNQSPSLGESMGASVNSILSETDLLSLTPSLDANMMVGMGNSISPSSLLHLQGGDVSSNTDDFASFHLTEPDTPPASGSSLYLHNSQRSILHHQQSTSQSSNNNNNNLNDLSSSIITSMDGGTGVVCGGGPSIMMTSIAAGSQHQQNQSQSANNALHSLNSQFGNSLISPTSFLSLIGNFSTNSNDLTLNDNGVGVGVSTSSSSLLKSSFDSDSPSNESSIGSPSRFLNLPPTSSSSSSTTNNNNNHNSTSTMSSIVEHRPNHNNNQQQQQQQQQSELSLDFLHSPQITNPTSASIVSSKSSLQSSTASSAATSVNSLSSSNSLAMRQHNQINQQQSTQNQIPNVKQEIEDDHEVSIMVTIDENSSRLQSTTSTILSCNSASGNVQFKPTYVTSGNSSSSSTFGQQRQPAATTTTSAYNNSSSANNSNNNKPIIKCSYCDRTFTKNSDLISHSPYHTGEKPYQCIKCGRSFSQKSNLRKHVQTHKIPPEEMTALYKSSLEAATEMVALMQSKQQQQTAKSTISNSATSNNNNNNKSTPTQISNPSVTSVVSKPISVSSNDNRNLANTASSQQQPNGIVIQTNANSSSVDSIVVADNNNKTSERTSATADSAPLQSSGFITISDSINGLTCPLESCDYCTRDEDELKSHLKQHDWLTLFKCTFDGCNQFSSDVESFLKHIQTHETTLMEPSYNDSSSNNNNNNNNNDASMLTDNSNPTDTGSGMEASSENQKPLKAKPKFFRCQTCLNRYTTLAALEQHKANTSHHYPCEQCSKIFPCERYLRRHILTHNAGLFTCKYCDKSFKSANYLKIHVIIHTGEKPFACKICDAAFNRRDKLKRHELVHDPIKRFKCPLSVNGCTREFNRPDKLKAHILTHSGIKPHRCTICTRSFTRRAHLREHCKTHESSGIKIEPSWMSTDSIVNSTTTTTTTATSISSGTLADVSSDGGSAKFITTTSGMQTDQHQNINSENANNTVNNLNLKSIKTELQSSTTTSSGITTPLSAVKSISTTGKTTSNTSTMATFKLQAKPSLENLPLFKLSNEKQSADLGGNKTTILNETSGNFILVSQSMDDLMGNNSHTTSANTVIGDVQGGAAGGMSVLPVMDNINFLNNYVLLYPCSNCDNCFLKESEFKSHKCNQQQRQQQLLSQSQSQQQQPLTIQNIGASICGTTTTTATFIDGTS